jgi:hypothetical protein
MSHDNRTRAYYVAALRALSSISGVLAALSALSAVIVYLSWSGDREVLRGIAAQESRSYRTVEQSVVGLNTWVYHNKGFAKNKAFFLHPSLGPTPIQVLEAGGDCADKSRLLAALLSELGVKSTLAMLYPCPECKPVHTIVEARTSRDRIAVDPVFDVHVPDGNGGYLGIDELSRSPDALDDRIRHLREVRAAGDPIQYYSYDREHFRNARTVNWNKGILLRMAASVLSVLGYDPFRVARPMVLEDPKRLVLTASLGASGGFLLLSLLTGTRGLGRSRG